MIPNDTQQPLADIADKTRASTKEYFNQALKVAKYKFWNQVNQYLILYIDENLYFGIECTFK